MAAFLQRHWADNQVSCTVTFDPSTEGAQLPRALDLYQYQLKGVSFLPRLEVGAYAQMPYEEISEAEYDRLSAELSELDLDALYSGNGGGERFAQDEVGPSAYKIVAPATFNSYEDFVPKKVRKKI